MKRFLSFGFFLAALWGCAFFISSCKKSSGGGKTSSSQYYVKFKVDGTLKTFSADAEGNFDVQSSVGHYVSTLYGLNKLFVADTSAFDIGISDTVHLVANITYTNYVTTSSGELKAPIAIITYIDETGVSFAAWPDDFSFSGVISDTKILFTSVTSSTLKGNFSGTMYKSVDGTSPKHVVTEGEFYVKRVR